MYVESSLLKLIKNHKKHFVGGGSKIDLSSLIKGKEKFLVLVFATLMFQASLVYGIMMNVKDVSYIQVQIKRFIILIILIQLLLVIMLAFIPMHPFIKFIILTIFSVVTGLFLSIMASNTSQDVIKAALIGTITIFIMMLIFGVVLSAFGFNITWLSTILFFLLLVLILVRVVTMFMKTSNNLHKGIAICALLLFSMFIVYDTNNILQRDYDGDFVTASLDYLLDILNIFVNLIQLISGE
jgi:FtsH-binding integral membrane protein